MNDRLTIKIKKRSQAEICMGIILLAPFMFALFIQLFHLSNALKYICDAAYMFLILLFLINKIDLNHICKKEILWILVFLIYTLFVYVCCFQSPLYYLWGVRNNFRFYLVFFAFIAFIKGEDIEGFWKVFDAVFWINIIVSIIQYYIFNIEQDFLGGVFGVEVGCNGYSAIFMSIVVIKSIVLYMEKKETAYMCFSKCVATLFISALAELKFFFVAFVLIVFLAMMYTDFSWRKILTIIFAILGILAGLYFLGRVFPTSVNWFSIDGILGILSSESGYTSSGDLNRLYFIQPINDMWLKTWSQRAFGLGLGNCDTSSFTFLNTPFFEKYGDMHYSWMSHAFMYLECGFIGLAFYFGFFVLVYFSIRKIEKDFSGDARSYCRIARIMAVLCVVISVYNGSLRTEAGYMAYFVLAIPFALKRESLSVYKQQNEIKNIQ